jgi:hypothetical protein
MQEGTLDDLIALGTKYPEMRESIYEQAFYRAQMTGDVDRARKIMEQLPDGSAARRSMLEMLERQEKLVLSFGTV